MECTESQSPPGQVWMPMFIRSSGVNRANSWLLRSMNSCSMFRPVQGLRESFLLARRPSVKSTETRTAPASKHWRMSFSASSTQSIRNWSRE